MPTNIYGIPAALWSGMTANEQAAFNFKFLGGVQIKDIFYNPALSNNVAMTESDTTAMHVPGDYTPWTAITLITAGDLISNDGQDYICITTHTSTSTFDATKFSADVADLTVADVKNIKTYYKETMVQQPIPGIVTGVVGSEINTGVTITKKFFNILWNDLITRTVHTVKNHTQFNI